jgi:hypothetical protein
VGVAGMVAAGLRPRQLFLPLVHVLGELLDLRSGGARFGLGLAEICGELVPAVVGGQGLGQRGLVAELGELVVGLSLFLVAAV